MQRGESFNFPPVIPFIPPFFTSSFLSLSFLLPFLSTFLTNHHMSTQNFSFFWGGGGADLETIYNLCLILKTMS
jgi:hypothetical protein